MQEAFEFLPKGAFVMYACWEVIRDMLEIGPPS
jgi:hypothetical protein